MDNSPDDSTLGAYLRAARTRAGLSIRDLERLTSINNSYLTKLELNQKTNPSAEKLQRLAEALDIDPAKLLIFIGVKPSSVLPPANVYLRERYGLSEAEARAAAELIEERYGPQSNKHKKEVNDEQPDK